MIEKIKELSKKYSNDSDFGSEVRKILNKINKWGIENIIFMRIIKWFKNLFRTKDEQPEVRITEWTDVSGFPRKKYVIGVSGLSFSTKRKTVDNLLDSFKDSDKK